MLSYTTSGQRTHYLQRKFKVPLLKCVCGEFFFSTEERPILEPGLPVLGRFSSAHHTPTLAPFL